MIDPAADTGRYVAGALLNETEALGKVIPASGGWYTISELMSTIEKASGKKVTFNEVTDEQFKSFLPAAVATELTETFMLIRDWAYYGPGAESAVSEGLKVCDELSLLVVRVLNM